MGEFETKEYSSEEPSDFAVYEELMKVQLETRVHEAVVRSYDKNDLTSHDHDLLSYRDSILELENLKCTNNLIGDLKSLTHASSHFEKANIISDVYTVGLDLYRHDTAREQEDLEQYLLHGNFNPAGLSEVQKKEWKELLVQAKELLDVIKVSIVKNEQRERDWITLKKEDGKFEDFLETVRQKDSEGWAESQEIQFAINELLKRFQEKLNEIIVYYQSYK